MHRAIRAMRDPEGGCLWVLAHSQMPSENMKCCGAACMCMFSSVLWLRFVLHDEVTNVHSSSANCSKLVATRSSCRLRIPVVIHCRPLLSTAAVLSCCFFPNPPPSTHTNAASSLPFASQYCLVSAEVTQAPVNRGRAGYFYSQMRLTWANLRGLLTPKFSQDLLIWEVNVSAY